MPSHAPFMQTTGGHESTATKWNVTVEPTPQLPCTPPTGGGAGICNVHCAGVPSIVSASVYVPPVQASLGDCSVTLVWSQVRPIARQSWLPRSMHEAMVTAHPA